jgi:hypothetical protein
MLKASVHTSDIPSYKPFLDFQLLRLWSTSGYQWTTRISDPYVPPLNPLMQPSKKSQIPSQLSLVGAWLFLLITLGVMVSPLFTSWGYPGSAMEAEIKEFFSLISK